MQEGVTVGNKDRYETHHEFLQHPAGAGRPAGMYRAGMQKQVEGMGTATSLMRACHA
jgi:hypothetical protein